MMKCSLRFLVLLATGILVCQTARGVPVEWGSPLNSNTDTFINVTTTTDIADVTSKVYQVGSGPKMGKYVYTYQLSNISDVGLSFFSVVLNGGPAEDADKDDSVGDVAAVTWHIVNTSETVNASFERLILNGEESGLLWFFSDYGPDPTFGDGALFGTESQLPVFGKGDLYVPLPEPATVVLLSAASFWCFRFRKRFA